MRPPTLRLPIAIAASLLVAGCLYSRAQTESPRTATEQLLLTASVWRAIDALDSASWAGRDAAIEVHSLAGPDAEYLRAVLAERVRRERGRVVDTDAAEVVLVVFVQALGTAARGLEFGIPPIPFGGVATPSLPLFRILKQRGYTGVRTAVRSPDQSLLAEGAPVLGRASFELYSVLMFALRRNDIYPGEELDLAMD